MTGSNDEDPLERLRAADPAAGDPAPDHRRIRAAVDRRLAAADDDPGAAVGADLHPDDQRETSERERSATAAGGDQFGARRRRRQPLRYAAAAVGAVLFLGGGYALGSGTGGLTAGSTADRAAGSESQASGAASDQSAPEAAPEVGTVPQPELGDADGSTGHAQPAARPTVFTAGDLAAGPSHAHVYALSIAASAAGERATSLAAALGLPGEPREENGAWVVGGQNGGPVLWLHPDGTLEYLDPSLQSWACLPAEPQTEPGSSTPSGAGEGQSAAAECADAGVPAPPDAADTFTAFLTDAGLDAGQYEIRTDDSGAGATVTATLRLGGQASEVRIAGTVVPEGIAAVRGSVAAPTDLGEYPLISPAEAVQRLMDPRFAGGSEVIAVPDPRFTDSPEGPDSSSGVVAVPDPRYSGSVPSPGEPVPWPVRQVEITTAELTLVSIRTSAGVLVLPHYRLTGTDASGTEGEWTVPAVAEDAFDFDG